MQKHSDVNVYLFARYLQLLLLLLLLTFALIRNTPVVHSNMERPMQVRGLRVCYFRLKSALQSSSTFLIMTCPVFLNNFLPYFLLVLHLCLFLGFVFNFDLDSGFYFFQGGGGGGGAFLRLSVGIMAIWSPTLSCFPAILTSFLHPLCSGTVTSLMKVSVCMLSIVLAYKTCFFFFVYSTR